MATAPAPDQNRADKEVIEGTKALSEWTRYINGLIIAFLVTLYAGGHHIPRGSVTADDWHWFLRIVCGAVLALLLDRAHALYNLRVYRRKQRDIEKGLVRDMIFSKEEKRASWWLFYAKLTLHF